MKRFSMRLAIPLVAAGLFYILVLAAHGLAGQPGTASTQKPVDMDTTSPEAVFPQKQYEFASVMEGVEIKHDFIIENHGDAPLVIQNVRPD